MTTTFQKRQREMKKQEKQRSKAERRAQRKLDKLTTNESDMLPEALPTEVSEGVDAIPEN